MPLSSHQAGLAWLATSQVKTTMSKLSTFATATMLLTVTTLAAAPAGTALGPGEDHGAYEAGGILTATGSGSLFGGPLFLCLSQSPTDATLLYHSNDTGPDSINLTYVTTPCALPATCSLVEQEGEYFEGDCEAPWLEDGRAVVRDLERHDPVADDPASTQVVSFDLYTGGVLVDADDRVPSVGPDPVEYRFSAFGAFHGGGATA